MDEDDQQQILVFDETQPEDIQLMFRELKHIKEKYSLIKPSGNFIIASLVYLPVVIKHYTNIQEFYKDLYFTFFEQHYNIIDLLGDIIGKNANNSKRAYDSFKPPVLKNMIKIPFNALLDVIQTKSPKTPPSPKIEKSDKDEVKEWARNLLLETCPNLKPLINSVNSNSVKVLKNAKLLFSSNSNTSKMEFIQQLFAYGYVLTYYDIIQKEKEYITDKKFSVTDFITILITSMTGIKNEEIIDTIFYKKAEEYIIKGFLFYLNEIVEYDNAKQFILNLKIAEYRKLLNYFIEEIKENCHSLRIQDHINNINKFVSLNPEMREHNEKYIPLLNGMCLNFKPQFSKKSDDITELKFVYVLEIDSQPIKDFCKFVSENKEEKKKSVFLTEFNKINKKARILMIELAESSIKKNRVAKIVLRLKAD